jgi:peptide/nickel transport system substrate-binding protein
MPGRMLAESTRQLAIGAQITRRRWMDNSAHLLGLGAVASAASCGRRRHEIAADSITVLYPADETLLGPDFDMPAQFVMFLPLFKRNMRGEIEGLLAESWEHTPDFRTCTIRLRDGIRWHDGKPVTAHDVKFSLDIRAHPDVLWFPPDSYTVKVMDDLTYTITHYRHNLNGLMSVGGLMDDWTVFYPKHLLEKLDPKGFTNWEFWKHPVGNGPYRYVRHVPKTMMQLEANPGFYRGRPKIPRLILKFVDSGAGCIPELLSGSVDAAPYAKRTEVLKLTTNPRFAAYEQFDYDAGMQVLYWNHRRPLFQQTAIRKALTLAINRHELLQFLGFPPNTPVFDALATKEQVRNHQIAEPIPYDPVLANRLLDETGWSTRDRRGVRVRDGRPFEFSVISGYQPEFNQNEAAVYIQAQLRRIGVRMNIDPLQGRGIFERILKGDYDAALNAFWWNESLGRGGLLAAAGYLAPRFLQLDDEIHGVRTPAGQSRIYHELTRLFQHDVPATFLYPLLRTTVAARRIRGLEGCPNRGDITQCMGDLSLEGVS